MNITKNLIVFSFITVATLFQATAANAATTCTPVYGGGQSCIQSGNLIIDKKVQNPQNNAFVDNLGVNDPRYAPNQNVNFEITVTNTGSATFGTVALEDTLPKYVVLADGNTSMTVKDLKPNESKKLMLVGRIVEAGQIPGDQMITCVINFVTGTADNQTSADNAQFCIEKSGQPLTIKQPGPTTVPPQPIEGTTKGGLKVFPQPSVKTTPPTGPEALALFGLIPTAGIGYFLRKRSKIK